MRRDIGKNISRFRRELNMTPRALAGAAGLSKERVTEIESGRAEPNLNEIEMLAGALRQRPERLTGWKREGGPFILWWESRDNEKTLHVEWEKPFRLVEAEEGITEGFVKLVFEEVKP